MDAQYSITLAQTATKYANVAKTPQQAHACTQSLTRMIHSSMQLPKDPSDQPAANACTAYLVSLLTLTSNQLATGAAPEISSDPAQPAQLPDPNAARHASSLFQLITLQETTHIDRIVKDGPDRTPVWNQDTKHAHITAMEMAATIPNPFESLALRSDQGPDTQEEDSQKEKLQLWNSANNRYNETLSTRISPSLQKYPDLVERLHETDIQASTPAIGFHHGPETDCSYDEPPPPTWSVTAYMGFIHNGRRHFKAVTDPYPKATPKATALEHLALSTTALLNQRNNPNSSIPPASLDDIHRQLADMNTITHMALHQVTSKDVATLAQTAKEAGLPTGAVTNMLHRITYDDRLTTILADDPAEDWRKRISPSQARTLLEAAEDCGIDAHTAHHMILALGQNPYIAGANPPAFDKATINEIEQTALELGFPNHIIGNMLLPITEEPYRDTSNC